MKILEFRNVVRKDVPIYYRRLYTAVAVVDFAGNSVEIPLEFMLEHLPTGNVETTLFLPEKIDFPLVPLKKELKSHISALDSGGKLPL